MRCYNALFTLAPLVLINIVTSRYKSMQRIAVVFCLLLVTLPSTSVGGDVLQVFVSVLPQKMLVERIGGERVQVTAMVRPGHSPATYEPTPRQVTALAQADLYVRIGVPFEDAWMPRIRAANPDMQVSDARVGIALRKTQNHKDHGASLGQDETHDPHIWTSPLLLKAMGRNIRDELSELVPVDRVLFATNYDRFAQEMDTLDREIRDLLAHLQVRRFIVFHPSWGYFADTYGLVQVPIEKWGREPGARGLSALIEQAQNEAIKVVFVQPQFNRKAAEQLAQAIGGRVEVVDPLALDYANNLRRFARLIAEAGVP
jgi:zinc transport system substrate-binding protein